MSKLGLHVHAWNNQILNYCMNVGAAVIKSLDHNDIMVNEVKRAQPKSLLVARLWVPHQSLIDPIVDARRFTDLLLLHIDGCHYDAAEGYNEWDGDLGYGEGGPEGLENWKRYADFEAERSRILHREGLKSVVGGCSVGTPPEHWFSHFKPALEEGDFLHLHEYSAPRMWDAVNWHCLKYRHVYKYLKEHGLPMLPLIISECGIDGGVAGVGDRSKAGWRAFTSPRHYMEQWKWYDGRLLENDYVVGCCAFDCGPTPGMGWESFKMEPEMLNLWAPYVRVQGASYWEPKEKPMDIWKNVSPQIAQWRSLIEKCTREYPVPIPDYNGIHVSPAKVITCIIRIESNGDPKAVGGAGHAHGLMQVWKDHYPGLNLFDPEVNIRTGLEILKAKLDKARGNVMNTVLQDALYYYSGGPYWATFETYLADYWQPFVGYYKQFWGTDLEPKSYDPIQEAIADIESAQATFKAAYNAGMSKLDEAKEGLLEA